METVSRQPDRVRPHVLAVLQPRNATSHRFGVRRLSCDLPQLQVTSAAGVAASTCTGSRLRRTSVVPDSRGRTARRSSTTGRGRSALTYMYVL